MQDFSSVTEAVSALASLLTSLTGMVMAWFAYKEFLKSPEQEDSTEDSGAELRSLTVFKTSKQETILQVTPQGLQCRIEDTRPGRGGLQWVLSPTQCLTALQEGQWAVNPDYKRNTGLLVVGPKRGWLYSKNLHWDPAELEEQIKELLRATSALISA